MIRGMNVRSLVQDHFAFYFITLRYGKLVREQRRSGVLAKSQSPSHKASWTWSRVLKALMWRYFSLSSSHEGSR